MKWLFPRSTPSSWKRPSQRLPGWSRPRWPPDWQSWAKFKIFKGKNISRLVVPEGGPPQGWWWPWCGICRCRRSRGGRPAWRTPRSSSSSPPCWNSTPRSRPAWAHELLWNNPQATLNRIIAMIMHFGNIYAYHCHSIFRWPLCKGHVMLMLDLEGSVLGNNLRDQSRIVQILIFEVHHQSQ